MALTRVTVPFSCGFDFSRTVLFLRRQAENLTHNESRIAVAEPRVGAIGLTSDLAEQQAAGSIVRTVLRSTRFAR